MTIDHQEDAIRRGYVHASTRLDERPGAQVRVDVLAAAARAVEARPHDPVRPRTRAPFATRRWPLSAAALLVVSLMTGLIATQVLRDDQDRIVASSAPATATVPNSVAPARPAETIGSEAKPARAAPAPSTGAAAVAARSATVQRATTVQKPRIEEPSRAAIAQAGSAPSTTFGHKAMQTEAAPASIQGSEPAAPDDAGARRQSATSPMRPAAAVNTLQRSRADPPATPEAWAERIVRLRADGNDADADLELAALRQHYPAFVVPQAALESVRAP